MTTINEPAPIVPKPKKESKPKSRMPTVKLSDDDEDRLRQYLSSFSNSTKYVYQCAWRSFSGWSNNRGAQPLPSTPALVADYLNHLSEERGLFFSTIVNHRTAIAAIHRGAGHPDPTDNMRVKLVMQTIAQAQGRTTKCPAPLLTDEEMNAVRATADIKRPFGGKGKGMESNKRVASRARVDIALLSLLRDGRVRKAEAAALTWGNVDLRKNGTGRVTIPRPRKHQNAEVLPMSGETAKDLMAIRPKDPKPEDPVFGITTRQMRTRIRAATQAAGLGYYFLIPPAKADSVKDPSAVEKTGQ